MIKHSFYKQVIAIVAFVVQTFSISYNSNPKMRKNFLNRPLQHIR